MNTRATKPPVTPTNRTPARSHRVAGPAAWILGTISTTLSAFVVVQQVYVALYEQYTYVDMASAALTILGMELFVVAISWLAFLIPFVPLRRDHAVTRPAFWSAVIVGIATGSLLFAYVL